MDKITEESRLIMSSINKAIIVGYLGKDPETRYMPNGEAVTNITVATSEKWADKQSGEKKEATEWHRITFYRKLAETSAQYLKKGSLVYIEGKLQTRKWTDKEGIDRYTTEIISDRMQMLGGTAKSDDASPQKEAPSRKPTTKQSGPANSNGPDFADMDDDIPF